MKIPFLICFGWLGVLSVAAWLIAIVVCVYFIRHERRERRFAVALGFALAGVMLATLHSDRVGAFRLDRSDETRAAREAQQRSMSALDGARAPEGEIAVRFAEDDPGDSFASPVPRTGEPAYRQGGKRKRDSGKGDAELESVTRAAPSEEDPDAVTAVILPLPAYQLATQLNRVNMSLASLVLLGVLGILVGDYLRRFNRPVGGYAPLPITGLGMDQFGVQPLFVEWAQITPDQLREYLESIVRKGQTFVYFGDRLVPDELSLARLRVGRRGFWPRRLLIWGRDAIPCDPEFVFDGIWFGRYLFSVPVSEAQTLLTALDALLDERLLLRARARHLPHIIWEAGSCQDPTLLSRVSKACQATGIRFVMLST